jgi:hypothetical protein
LFSLHPSGGIGTGQKVIFHATDEAVLIILAEILLIVELRRRASASFDLLNPCLITFNCGHSNRACSAERRLRAMHGNRLMAL